jgi:hypothetical protein
MKIGQTGRVRAGGPGTCPDALLEVNLFVSVDVLLDYDYRI